MGGWGEAEASDVLREARRQVDKIPWLITMYILSILILLWQQFFIYLFNPCDSQTVG